MANDLDDLDGPEAGEGRELVIPGRCPTAPYPRAGRLDPHACLAVPLVAAA